MALPTYDDLCSYLGITDLDDPSTLNEFIDAAVAALTRRCGPLTETPSTATVPGGGTVLVLPEAPVVSLTSVTPVGGSMLDLAALALNGTSGLVELADGGTFSERRYLVDYTTGRADIPADLALAVKELVRHLWLTQLGNAPGSSGALPDSGESDFIAFSGGAYLFPPRVEQLIAPHLRVDL